MAWMLWVPYGPRRNTHAVATHVLQLRLVLLLLNLAFLARFARLLGKARIPGSEHLLFGAPHLEVVLATVTPHKRAEAQGGRRRQRLRIVGHQRMCAASNCQFSHLFKQRLIAPCHQRC